MCVCACLQSLCLLSFAAAASVAAFAHRAELLLLLLLWHCCFFSPSTLLLFLCIFAVAHKYTVASALHTHTHTHTGAAAPKLHSLSPRSCPLASLASPLTSMISVVAAADDDGDADADDGNGNGDVNSNGFQLFSCQVQRGGEGGS